jgi:uncharacterized protein
LLPLFLAAAAGCVGGIYGIGGGSILAPVLIGTGRRPSEVAPAALASTFVTSVAGVVTFTILSIHEPGSVAPDWPVGVALGAGGLAGAHTGARLQSRLSRGGFSVTFMLVPVRLRGSRPRRWWP